MTRELQSKQAIRLWRLQKVREFLDLPTMMTGEWQSQDISDKPMLATRELLNETFTMGIPVTPLELADRSSANLPWAEDHFQERVSGDPLNPPPSEAWWPFAQQGNKDSKEVGDEKFSHTYPERMWPRWAGEDYEDMATSNSVAWEPRRGIRYEYGDLQDVVNQLKRGPLTRQAYLPIWFPEDTGAISGQRVPCTLGYHFLIRQGVMQITYYIRSCDFIRHFSDDVYMAGRLLQWMCGEVGGVVPGKLVMHMVSFHVFEGDTLKLRQMEGELQRESDQYLMGAF